MKTTEFSRETYTVLERITWLSQQDSNAVYHSLMHHINEESLRSCFRGLDGKKAVGTDGVTKEMYGTELDANLDDLLARMKRMAYRPSPVLEVLIEKEGKPGATRPLGIAIFEDKIVQKRIQEILEAIYDPIFSEFSYGFRPGRSCHDAVKRVNNYLHSHEVETVIDVDLANYFGTIDHDLLTEMLEWKIKDKRLIRYIRRMFKAGVLADGDLRFSDFGVPQGSICSPVLSNVFAHYVIDEWLDKVVRKHTKGPIEVCRYADDLVILCRYHTDAERIKEALGKRLAKYKLKMNEEKTKLVRFSRNQFKRKGVKQQTFDFLGFTFYLGRTRKGNVTAKLKTSGKRIRAKLNKIKAWIREVRSKLPLKEILEKFRAKLRGHIQYYGVSHNFKAVSIFVAQATRIIFKWLNRRSQKKSFDWEKFQKLLKRFPLPEVRICHALF